MKLDFTQPPPQPKTLEEAQEIINALWVFCRELSERVESQQKQIEAQQKEINELKEKLNTNSKNSSKPPSSDKFKQKPTPKPNKKNKRKQGGQPGHKGVTRALLPENEVDYIEKCHPKKRCDCGSHIKLTGNYRPHQVHELPRVKAIVTEYQLHSGACSGCGKLHQAKLPNGIPVGMLGPIAIAKIGTLTGDYKMSKRNIISLFGDFYGLYISTGTVSNAEKIVSAALEIPVEEAKIFIPQQVAVHADETRHTEKKQKMWSWVFIASLVAAFIIRPSRGARVAKDFLGETFKGILSSDRYSGYAWLATVFRQLCWAHLLRDFKKISERSGTSGRVGEELLMHTNRMFHYWHKVKDGVLSRQRFKKLMKPIRTRVEVLLLEGKRCRHKNTAGTCKHILKLKEALWTFIEKEGVEPTNNLAEQILRRLVIWRKTSFSTQSAAGTLYLERIMTTVATCKLQKRNVLDFVTDAIRAHLSGTLAPSLLPNSINDIGLLKAA